MYISGTLMKPILLFILTAKSMSYAALYNKPINIMLTNHVSEPILYTYTDTPIGRLLLVAKGNALIGIYSREQMYFHAVPPHWKYHTAMPCFDELRQQLYAYFKGSRDPFTVPYVLSGTPLQRETWTQLNSIPYGEQISYKALAQLTSSPHAIRAVATAVGCNPLLIVLPCHRVVRSDGKLGGFSAGLPFKQHLLDLEEKTYDASWLNRCVKHMWRQRSSRYVGFAP